MKRALLEEEAEVEAGAAGAEVAAAEVEAEVQAEVQAEEGIASMALETVSVAALLEAGAEGAVTFTKRSTTSMELRQRRTAASMPTTLVVEAGAALSPVVAVGEEAGEVAVQEAAALQQMPASLGEATEVGRGVDTGEACTPPPPPSIHVLAQRKV